MKYIFESLNKAKQFIKISDKPIDIKECLATGGSFLDLSSSNYGVSIEGENLVLLTEIKKTKRKLIETLKTLKDDVLILTDADFEGERIAFDINEIIKNNCKVYRSHLKSYTKNNFKKLNIFEYNSSTIEKYNINKILRIQKIRRIIDRIIGFAISNKLSFQGFLSGAGRSQIALLTAIKNFNLIKVKNSPYYKPLCLHDDNFESISLSANYGKYYNLATLTNLLSTARNSKVAYNYLQGLYESGIVTYLRTDNDKMDVDYAGYLGREIPDDYIIDTNKIDGFFPHEGIRFTLDFLDYLCSIKDEDKILEELNKTYMENFIYTTDNLSYKFSPDFFDLFRNISLYSYRSKYEDLFKINATVKREDNSIPVANTLFTLENDIDLNEEGRVVIEPIKTEADMIFAMGVMGTSAPSTYIYTINKLYDKKLLQKTNSREYTLTSDGNQLYDILSDNINLNKYISTKYKEIIYNGVIENNSDIEILSNLVDYFGINISIKDNKLSDIDFKKEEFKYNINSVDNYKLKNKTKNNIAVMF